MATKKKQSTIKPLVKQVLPKKKRRAVKARVKPRLQRRFLDAVLDVHSQIAGGVVTVSLTTGPEVTELDVSVNGRGVWKGQP